MKKNIKPMIPICLILLAGVLIFIACNAIPSQNNTEQTTSSSDEQVSDFPAIPPSNLAYRVNNDGSGCTIIGIGTCTDKNLVIPSNIDGYKVTSIGYQAFSNNEDLLSVYIPVGVVSIDDEAFKGCINLGTIVLPEGLTNIGTSAFYGCHYITEITIPNSVVTIADSVFEECVNLAAITFGENDRLINIGANAFFNCGKLTNIVIPKSVISIGCGAFFGCDNLESMTIPVVGAEFEGELHFKHLFEKYDYLWGYVANITMRIPTTLTTLVIAPASDNELNIEASAFSDFTSLTSVTLCSGITSIGGSAFSGCSNLTNITIPESVTSIGTFSFSRCENLTSIIFNGTTEQWKAIEFGTAWNSIVPATLIVCSNGIICNNHTEVVNEAISPTCTETGLTEGKHCSVCGEVLIAQEIIPATGNHNYKDVVFETNFEAMSVKYTCTHCGDYYIESFTDVEGTPTMYVSVGQGRKVNFHLIPSTDKNATIIMSLPHDTEVTVLKSGTINGTKWNYVEVYIPACNDIPAHWQNGYIIADFLSYYSCDKLIELYPSFEKTEVSTMYVVIDTVITIRSAPVFPERGEDNALCNLTSTEESVKFLEVLATGKVNNTQWYIVEYIKKDGESEALILGFVGGRALDYLTSDTKGNPTVSLDNLINKYPQLSKLEIPSSITANSITNCYGAPDVTGEVLGQIAKGTEVTLVAQEQGTYATWYVIETADGKLFFVGKQFSIDKN